VVRAELEFEAVLRERERAQHDARLDWFNEAGTNTLQMRSRDRQAEDKENYLTLLSSTSRRRCFALKSAAKARTLAKRDRSSAMDDTFDGLLATGTHDQNQHECSRPTWIRTLAYVRESRFCALRIAARNDHSGAAARKSLGTRFADT
jgi:hypothetical protein